MDKYQVTEVLMCRPEYYTVSYKINPWMSPQQKPNKQLADAQWKTLYETMRKIGIKIKLMDPVPTLPDMVFTANAGLVFNHTFILSNFRYPQRQPESDYFKAWAESNGFSINRLPVDHFFEGEGDALYFKDVLIAGYRFRSDIQSHLHIGNIIKKEVLSVELVNPHYYHLDTCFCPLDDMSALYYPGAFDSYGKAVLQNSIPNLIPIPVEDAKRFCCNAVVAGRNIIINTCSNRLKEILEDLGFKLYILEFNEFIKAGGSCKCMILFLKKASTKKHES